MDMEKIKLGAWRASAARLSLGDLRVQLWRMGYRRQRPRKLLQTLSPTVWK